MCWAWKSPARGYSGHPRRGEYDEPHTNAESSERNERGEHTVRNNSGSWSLGLKTMRGKKGGKMGAKRKEVPST